MNPRPPGRPWWRTLAGWLALGGLSLQLLLSIGHLHADDVFGPGGRLVQVGLGPVAVSAAPAPAAGVSDEGLAADFCDLCAAMALLAAGLAPMAAAIAGPRLVLGRVKAVLVRPARPARRGARHPIRAPPRGPLALPIPLSLI